MTSIAPGTPAPDFSLNNAEGSAKTLSDLKGRWTVLYFYPKDNTPGCTLEANEFNAARDSFQALQAHVVGVSPDSCKSHQNFAKKQGLTIELLSDPEKTMLETYGVWQEKSMYGRSYMGVVRTTLLIDPEGVIREVWSKVKVKGHVEAVLQRLKELQTS